MLSPVLKPRGTGLCQKLEVAQKRILPQTLQVRAQASRRLDSDLAGAEHRTAGPVWIRGLQSYEMTNGRCFKP